MPSTNAKGSNDFTVDQGTNTIRFERRVDADRADVFDAWTTPDEVIQWWDPTGEPLVACEIDLRVGGTFSFVTRDHPEMPFSGVYREIARPGRLVFEALGAVGRVALETAGNGTQMTVEITCSSAEHLEQFTKLGVAHGTARTLDNLVARVGGGWVAR